MTTTDSITAVVTVGLGPSEAFRAFTEDAGAWFRLTPASFSVRVSTVEFDTRDRRRFVMMWGFLRRIDNQIGTSLA